MKKKLILALILILVISIPLAIAAVQQSQTVHISKSYTPPNTVTPTPTPTASVTPNQVAFSLFYPNGTTYNLNQDHLSTIQGAQNLDVNSVPCYIQSGLGAPPTGYPMGVIVVRNDGNVPITMQAAVSNLVKPSDVDFLVTCYRTNPGLWGTQPSTWMGYNNYASTDTVQPGQYIWLSVCITLTSNEGNSGVIRNHPAFDYNFDLVVTATQA